MAMNVPVARAVTWKSATPRYRLSLLRTMYASPMVDAVGDGRSDRKSTVVIPVPEPLLPTAADAVRLLGHQCIVGGVIPQHDHQTGQWSPPWRLGQDHRPLPMQFRRH